MIGDLSTILAALLILVGAGFTLVAALGLLRLPDLFTRMHAASKAGCVGSTLMLLALSLTAETTAESLRALVGIAFFLLTAPISAHLLARAAYASGQRLWKGTVVDDMAKAGEKGAGRTGKADSETKA